MNESGVKKWLRVSAEPEHVTNNWIRVTKADPCPICQHDSWCGYLPNSLVCCMRVADGAIKTLRNGGHLHRRSRAHQWTQERRSPSKRPTLPLESPLTAWQRWSKATIPADRTRLARSLGVDEIALDVLGAVFATDHNAWAFPMRDADGSMIGIRFRNAKGDKWALRGSRAGLFVPQSPSLNPAWIVEGPTDCAAALSLGLYAIGRHAALGQEDMLSQCLLRQKIQRAVIVADNDGRIDKHTHRWATPGITGAERLQQSLRIPSCLLIPPTKDLRELVAAGYDHQLLLSLLAGLRWTRPAYPKG